MKDYAQYSSRIPSPNGKARGAGNTTTTTTTTTTASSPKTKVTTTRNVRTHPLSSYKNNSTSGNGSSPPDKREKDNSVSSSGSQNPRQPPSGSPQQLEQQQLPDATSATKSPRNNNSSNSSSRYGSASRSHSPTLNASDALSLRRDGSEVTVQRLREQLDEANSRDNTAKAALAKSDAVILELRSHQRQLKKQLELLQQEKSEWRKNVEVAKIDSNHKKEQQIQSLQLQIADLTRKLQVSEQRSTKDAKVGELQIQLDRAHAQILTADMVRKELEDTLEAEQYTWELRVQDQDRQIAGLQSECDTLAQDLDQCRSQWKEAEQGWNEEVEELRTQLQQAHASRAAALSSANGSSAGPQSDTGSHMSRGSLGSNARPDDLMSKIHQLERERAELQSCLDEALKELEAVDAELQTEDGNKSAAAGGKDEPQTVESLQHLLRWIYQEGPTGGNEGGGMHNMAKDPKVLVDQIQVALEEWLEVVAKQASTRQSAGDGNERSVPDLENQISAYQQELKSREESSSELRDSLKEAVALLKPLQDAVAQAEEEKNGLQQMLQDMERDRISSQATISQQSREIEGLMEQVSGLGEQLEEQRRLASAREVLLSTPSPKSRQAKGQSTEDSLGRIQRAREELRRKRETEGNLQQLLKDAQSRFHNLHQQNENAAARNRELQGQIEQLGVEDEGLAVAELVAKRDAEIRSLREQVERLQNDPAMNGSGAHAEQLEEELRKTRGELAQREQAERVLNRSLKEALGLLKPLQSHLEEAEMEKMEISKELRNLRKRFRQLQMGESDDQSKSTMGGQDVSIELIKIKDELEETVQQLELENSQLHDALEDLTEADGSKHNNEAKLRQNLVELNSRYEVTQNKLEDAHVENHALVKALKQKEIEELKRKSELRQLHERLNKTEAELSNAKSIARSALVKVEELTMSNIEQLSREDSPSVDAELHMIEAAAANRLGGL